MGISDGMIGISELENPNGAQKLYLSLPFTSVYIKIYNRYITTTVRFDYFRKNLHLTYVTVIQVKSRLCSCCSMTSMIV